MLKTINISLVLLCSFQFVYAQDISKLKRLFNGPLKVSSENRCYFTDSSGKAILLTGSHTWANFQDHYLQDQEKIFDWEGYLNMITENNHNFIRLWMFEHPRNQAWTIDKTVVTPMIYRRIGAELAYDGEPKFDLTQFNQLYFDRLRQRIIQAGERGVYVAIMLFNGWSQNKLGDPQADPFLSHPFNINNNINGIDVNNTTSDSEEQKSLHSMAGNALDYQEKYVKKVIETVNDLDNVLYEIINEGGTTDWQYHMVHYVKKIENGMPNQHMVGLGSRMYPLQYNYELWQSPADYISPTWEPLAWSTFGSGSSFIEDYGDNPPANKKNKVCIIDTDHLWGHGGNYKWAWKSFCRGLNPIFMDPWEPAVGNNPSATANWHITLGGVSKNQKNFPDYEPLRKNLGYIRKYSQKVDLKKMSPDEDISSTGYCLANVGVEYIIYFPDGGKATINLSNTNNEFYSEWFIPILNQTIEGAIIKGGRYVVLEAPFVGDAVLYLKSSLKMK